jgi:hypothetical protein
MLDQGGCKPCETCNAGFYRSDCSRTSQGTCKSCTCPVGQYMSDCSTTSNAPGTCKPCQTCDAGKYLLGCSGTSPGVCTACETGKYSSSAGAVSCQPCTKGIDYANAEGLTGCKACSTGSCNAGQEIISCEVDKDAYCKDCTTKPAFSQYTTNCAFQCSAGYYKKSETECEKCTTYDANPTLATEINCPVDQYFKPCSADVNGKCSPCTNKPSDSYYTASSGEIPDNCAWACNAGFYKDGDTAMSCTKCKDGFYSTSPGKTACSPCGYCTEKGMYKSGCGKASAGDCVSCTNTS